MHEILIVYDRVTIHHFGHSSGVCSHTHTKVIVETHYISTLGYAVHLTLTADAIA